SGEVNVPDASFNFHADEGACLLVIHRICAGAVVNISHGPGGIGGAGGCLQLGPVSVGGGIQWNRITRPFIWPFDGCKWSRFAIDVKPTGAAVKTRETIKVIAGHPSPAIKLYGHGAAPKVRVTGPGGQLLDSTDKGLDLSPGGKIRILRFQGKTESFTIVG